MSELFDESFDESAAPDSHAEAKAEDRRATVRHREGRRKAQRRRNIVTFVVMVGALALLIGGGWALIRPMLTDRPTAEASDYPGPGTGEAQVVVSSGDTGADIGATLEVADVVASASAFVSAYNANAEAIQIQAGTFTLQQQMRASDAVAALLDPGSRSDVTITIPEGWRASKIYERIANRLEVPRADVEAAAVDVSANGLPPEANGSIEGWLFASTYTIVPGSTPTSVLQQMVAITVQALDERAVPAEQRIEVLTKASIVEAEVPNAEEWGRVARVIENRLGNCSDDGTLGMDTTYAYGLDKPAYEITKTEWATDHPYNGRLRAGLPPTPIGAPGAGAIEGVLNPPAGDWCYFVTVNPEAGDTRFTASIEEHLANQQLYRDWLAQQQTATETPTETLTGSDG
ncbi:MAG: endolytic transglycosylase MltG [Actinomycetales bacterium]|nr:endolytic transglycosylase MltG [Actinomycetales bacterium]